MKQYYIFHSIYRLYMVAIGFGKTICITVSQNYTLYWDICDDALGTLSFFGKGMCSGKAGFPDLLHNTSVLADYRD